MQQDKDRPACWSQAAGLEPSCLNRQPTAGMSPTAAPAPLRRSHRSAGHTQVTLCAITLLTSGGRHASLSISHLYTGWRGLQRPDGSMQRLMLLNRCHPHEHRWPGGTDGAEAGGICRTGADKHRLWHQCVPNLATLATPHMQKPMVSLAVCLPPHTSISSSPLCCASSSSPDSPFCGHKQVTPWGTGSLSISQWIWTDSSSEVIHSGHSLSGVDQTTISRRHKLCAANSA